MKVLLVDDKESVVQGIRKHIPWDRLDVAEVETAMDGLEALAKQRTFKADLIITDIRMPNMDGIELMEKLKDEGESVWYIVLSGYEEFDYAKQALSLGASDYVLKPVNIEELTGIIDKVLQDIRIEKTEVEQKVIFQQKIKKSLPALRRQYLNEMIHFQHGQPVRFQDKWAFAEIPLKPQAIGLLCFSIDHFSEIARTSIEEVELSRFIVENIVEDCLKEWGEGIAFFPEWGRLVLMVNYNPSLAGKQVKEQLVGFAESCRQAVEQNSKLTVTIGVSSLCPEINNLPEAFRQAMEAIDHVYFFDRNLVVHYEDLVHYRGKQANYPSAREKELIAIVRRGQTNLVDRAVDQFINELKQGEGTPHQFRYSCIQLVTVLSRILSELGLEEEHPAEALKRKYEACESANLYELHEQITEWVGQSARLVSQSIQTGSKHIVDQAKDFIQRNVQETISLSTVADYVKVSPTYLSGLFKKETSSTFLEYVTDTKMEQAKDWLKNSPVPIYEIAERLGYYDRKYFREMFKKKVGMTPSEYRESETGTLDSEG
ncbi:response regulator [Paenibacillus sp. J2TS4]|uniref:response regulator n=1 Tax=Paenibacillus sp. J2TS4 TaxID=2807194 RepID=UPI001B00B0AA|nr:response regulator [Paenibacillus sp. J2TS4]GIP33262.1 DNA-binding response regulator [Paenibacillus sp. J2TS4]